MMLCRRKNCGHGTQKGWCANPECSSHPTPWLQLWHLYRKGAAFRTYQTPTGLWLWVLDTGRQQ